MSAASRRHTRRDRQVDELLMRSKQLRAEKSTGRPMNGKSAMLSAFILRQEARPRSRVLGAVSVCRNITPRPYQPGSVARALIAQAERALAPLVESAEHCLDNAVIPTDEAGNLDEVHGEIFSNAETAESSDKTAPDSNDEPSIEAEEVHEGGGSDTNILRDSAIEIGDQEAEQNLENETPKFHEDDTVNTSTVEESNAEIGDQQVEQNPEKDEEKDEDFELILDDDEIQYWLEKSRHESPAITTTGTNNSPTAMHAESNGQSFEPEQHNNTVSKKHKRDAEDIDDHTDESRSPPKLAKHNANDDKASSIRPSSRAAGGPSTCAHYTNIFRANGRKDCTCPNYTDLGLDERFRGPIYYRIADNQEEEGLPGKWINGRWEFPDPMTAPEAPAHEPEPRDEDEEEDCDSVVVINYP
ncbi:hypothetical protein EJ03DRAFT_38706 [Teratosphaeria nubilosa]|uniref:Uncharacterized protein n=1 Tax=Teratosphaeria nubilosa TaxID=161662 RepID=A0A6G1LFC8_9PEZI|nr:hypothetical protein EJ03DRAFT_38706 [Teratosphaeria nubilosa]